MADNQVQDTDETPVAVDDEVDTDENTTATEEADAATEAKTDAPVEKKAITTAKSTAPAASATEKKSARRAKLVGALRSSRRAVPALVAVLLVGLAAATGILGWEYKQQRDLEAASSAALRAATDYAVTLTSVDTNNLDANFTAVLAGSTGEFRDVYTKSSTQLRQLLIDHKASGHGVVLQAAVKSASEDEVVVLLFVDQTVSNTEMPDPRIDHSRIVMTMQNVDGQWKAAKVDIP
ncbi:DUF3329 domain-containing protein [Nocardia sp. NPDC050406]|uniref:DUF3329 domain-containing protein n=1 Tax=Nocardia sp. NPDC050406 TaxID=3364318 RepID=UPI0037BA0C43